MEPVVLTDPFIIPNEVLVFSIIGDKSILWQGIISYLHDNHSDISEVWRFYNDGKCWLFRTLKKKKTIFWIGVIDGTFRITFWLGDKASPLIAQSDLPGKIKDDFENAKSYKIGRALSIKMEDKTDMDSVIKLIGIKLKIK
jgi:hypothetical protein